MFAFKMESKSETRRPAGYAHTSPRHTIDILPVCHTAMSTYRGRRPNTNGITSEPRLPQPLTPNAALRGCFLVISSVTTSDVVHEAPRWDRAGHVPFSFLFVFYKRKNSAIRSKSTRLEIPTVCMVAIRNKPAL